MSGERTLQREWPKLLSEFKVQQQLAIGPCATSLLVRMIGDPERRGEMVLKVFHHVAIPTWKAVKQVDTTAVDTVRAQPHANLAVTYEVGQLVDDVYVLQEYVDGIDLRTLMSMYPEPDGEFSVRHRLGIAVQLAAALEHLHTIRLPEDRKARFIHGDIYPGNVIIGRDGGVRLLDLGYAEVARNVIRPSFEGSALGSPGYMAPEQLANRRSTPATDVYAFGALLAELMLGEPLFRADTTTEIIEQSQAVDIDDALARIGEHHPGAARLVQRSVTRERKGRIVDGVLLVGEMFAVGVTDPADEQLAALVQSALASDPLVLPPRDLIAADGSAVDILQRADGATVSEFMEPSLDEPSYESGSYTEYSDGMQYASGSEPAVATTDPPTEPTEEEALPSVELETAEEPAVQPSVELEAVEETADEPRAVEVVAIKPGETASTPAATPAPAPKKSKKGLTIALVAVAAVMLLVCAGVSVPTLATFLLKDRAAPADPSGFVQELPDRHVEAEVDESGQLTGVVRPLDDGEPLTDEDALTDENETEDENEDENENENETEVDEEPTPEPEPLSPEELERQREEDERRRLEREERDRERREAQLREQEDSAPVDTFSREDSLADTGPDIDWGDMGDGEEDWLADGSGPTEEDAKIDIDIDSITRTVDVASASGEPPKVRHTPIARGKAGSTVTLRLTVTPSGNYTGVVYYRGSPGGSWSSMNISGGDNGKITVKLYLGDWLEDDHGTVEYYFLVDGPGGSAGAGTRLSPYSFDVR